MDILKDKVKPIYIKYLTASFASSFISSIYTIVDAAMIGQYEGPNGSAALAIVSPVWNIIYSLGLLVGIGGSVLYSNTKGKGNHEDANAYFSSGLLFVSIISFLVWILIFVFDKQLLLLFGADEALLPLALSYIKSIKVVVPCFLFAQFLSAFLRNDNDPGLATKAVLLGGLFNVFGDYFFVFTLNLGIFGAGLATAIGSLLTLLILLTHFKSEKNTLHFSFPKKLFVQCKEISTTGFSTFFIDIALGIVTVLFNRQVMKYLSSDALSVYGVIININCFVQGCAYSVGQASQPIISTNFGAKKYDRIKETLRYSLYTCIGFGSLWLLLVEVFPNAFVYFFMSPTDSILSISSSIIRAYGISFVLLPFNIFSTYYFEAILKPSISFIISVCRGAIISGILILLLPITLGGDSIWYAMPITELLISIYVIINIKHINKTLN